MKLRDEIVAASKSNESEIQQHLVTGVSVLGALQRAMSGLIENNGHGLALNGLANMLVSCSNAMAGIIELFVDDEYTGDMTQYDEVMNSMMDQMTVLSGIPREEFIHMSMAGVLRETRRIQESMADGTYDERNTMLSEWFDS